ncbi:hypothetical protein K458DRAFT_388530 [Lentithecium fluviatile CBS 122367]|uniref:DH domain-containing protein n=1 Tax=Lentithecium fluviatile CBS 122367 TaxID=1168545 RepID=A0A6G1J2U6_9PLEO|nr:hypothetical protein K458DRAFT_388530 [Lentithecium fluviatile CBS 122367]
MAEPEHSSMHNFAYHPSVASWVQSTALAHLDSASDEVAEPSPDDFYKAAPTHTTDLDPSHPTAEMTTTRQRQQTTNGAARSTPKPSVRSVSGSVTSTTSTPRSALQVPSNRPTVKSLAQKFNQPSSTETSPLSTRTRTVRPPQTTASSSPARPVKEASYGAYKFNHLKPRERPQPAPPSPANTRRTNGRASLTSLDQPSTPARRKLSSPTRGSGRQPFFGEVVGDHNASSLGFGIPTLESTSHSIGSPPAESSTIKLVTEELQSLPEHPHPDTLSPAHRLPPGEFASQGAEAGETAHHPPSSDNRTPRKRSPPSRIPVASRRLSTASDSSSSTRSARINGARRPVAGYSKTSPTRPSRVPVGSRGATSPKKSKAPSQPTLPAVSYRGYRERGKSPQGANRGPSVAAVITAPLPPTSPRLRNSRERQKLQESPGSRSRSADPHASPDYFGNGTTSTARAQPRMLDAEHVDGKLSVKLVTSPTSKNETAVDMNSQLPSTETAHRRALSLSTDGLHVPPTDQPTSSATSFEYDESPVLGMPGSFMMTPPIAQKTPPLDTERVEPQKYEQEPAPSEGELLQARTFQAVSKEPIVEAPKTDDVQDAPSELSLRESIPIMLGSDGPAGWIPPSTRPPMHAQRLSIGSQTWRAEPLDSTGTISYLEEDDSPIDPFSHRDTLRPDDSASVAFYRQAGQRSPNWTPQMPSLPDAGSFTLDSEAYSVINKVLNMYHESEYITPELAQDSRTQVQGVSPIIAQHKDWGSKEATETYLARLLSDAAGSESRSQEPEAATPEQPSYAPKQGVPALSIRELEADPEEPIAGGTAIIFPPESRRYSRDSRGSGGSTTTTIWEGPSRPDSSSGFSARDRVQSNGNTNLAQVTYPSPAEWSLPRQAMPNQLPEIAGAGEGLGLSLHDSQQQTSHQSPFQMPPAPPRPAYSPPPPPTMDAMTSRVLSRGRHGYMALSSNDELRVSASLDDHPAHGPPLSPRDDPEATPTAALQPDPAESAPELAPTIMPVPGEQPSGDTPFSTEAGDQRPQVDETTKMVQKRYRVIEELTKTEHSFCVDMMVAHQIFEGTSREVLTDQERRLLFSNCKDLESFSHALWKSLKEAIKPIVNQTPPAENSDESYDEFLCCTPENDRLVKVGNIIMAATPRMERVYTTYYLNYGDASEFIKKNTNNPELLGWVMACFQHCPNLTSAWDLDSLLIKPVQRMLRYPLLLDDLISKTSPDHPDLPELKAASDSIKQIASRIEMAKKRQQTLRAATSEGKKEKNKGRLGKTIVKAFISTKDRAKTLQEASQIFEDQEYNQVTQKFGGHFFQIQIVIRDFDQYLDAITEQMLQLNSVMLGFITVSETGPSANAEMESTWRRWAMAYIDLQNKVLDEHKTNVRNRVMKPICEVWDQWVSPQKLMEQRKKALLQYAKYKQAVDRKEKVESKLEEAAKDFMTINDSLKQELPKLYELTKNCIRLCEIIFLGIQKDWYKTCSKKILPLLESEPQHTTSITYDFKVYVDRFKSDFRQMEDRARSLAIVNHDLMNNMANFTSPNPTFYSDDASSRKSSSRRTESMGSEMSMLDHRNRNRNSGGYGSTRSGGMHSFDGPPRSSPAAPYAGPPTSYPAPTSAPTSAGLSHGRERGASGATSPYSQASDATITQRTSSGRPSAPWTNLDGAFEPTYDTYAIPASIGASFLNPHPNAASNHSLTPTTTSSSTPGSSRASGVFNSALPMAAGEDPPATPNADMDEPEVLFLAASLFEFNIAHDRREGGIPYLVYVPGEIFDVIGMKGELWLARNQDDPSRTVGWIWEKHFARILPEDA